jgi:prophage regulatory protein
MSTAVIAITDPIRILRLPEVCKSTGLGRAMIYRLQAEQRFPKSVKITEHAVGWIEREVQAWLAERVAARLV